MELTEDKLREVVALTPLVSIDLLVRDAFGKILLGRRKNHPGEGYWFVPGRRIRKGETLQQALVETCREELHVDTDPDALRLVDAFDHMYPEIFTGEHADGGTHYVVLLYELDAKIDVARLPLHQHSEYAWMSVEELLSSDRVHPNAKKFFSAGRVPFNPLTQGQVT